MQKIVPFLWFDTQAAEAAKFYASVFKNAKVKNSTILPDTPSGDTEVVTIEIEGMEFQLMSAGPYFKINPSISFSVACESEEEIDHLWAKLSDGGEVLMPFQAYPFSKKYGWLSDKYGVNWQLNLQPNKQKIRPSFIFTQKNFGKCEEAMKFYVSLFPNSSIKEIYRYEKGEHDKEGMIKHAVFILAGIEFIAMESSLEHKFTFNEGVSLLVNCKTQEEIDHYWNKMSAVKESEQCGWLKDKFGVSWQITPAEWEDFIRRKENPEATDRYMKAMMQMKKMDIQKLRDAYEGK